MAAQIPERHRLAAGTLQAASTCKATVVAFVDPSPYCRRSAGTEPSGTFQINDALPSSRLLHRQQRRRRRRLAEGVTKAKRNDELPYRSQVMPEITDGDASLLNARGKRLYAHLIVGKFFNSLAVCINISAGVCIYAEIYTSAFVCVIVE